MQIGKVVGLAVASVKHKSLEGWRLLLVQPLGADESADGEPLLAIDNLGAAAGQRVMLSSAARAGENWSTRETLELRGWCWGM